jgi:Fe-S cluster assembly ATP-binding protein
MQRKRHSRTLVALALLAPEAVVAASFATAAARSPAGARSHGRAVALRMDGAASATLLDVAGLTASVAEQPILNGVDLKVQRGEVHAIMGPNGSGKSTLSKVLVGHPAYEVTGGSAVYRGEDLLESEPEERAQQGVFLAFQYPVEVPGVSNSDFLRLAVNKRRGAQGLDEYDPIEFMGVLAEKMGTVGMSTDFIGRDVNSGFSGGEKKRNEILQMALLEPELAILDETDSGLDIDALKTVAEGVNAYRSEGNAIVLITHYQRLLDYIKPDHVHVMYKGRIVRSGGPELALELEQDGYSFLGEGADMITSGN